VSNQSFFNTWSFFCLIKHAKRSNKWVPSMYKPGSYLPYQPPYRVPNRPSSRRSRSSCSHRSLSSCLAPNPLPFCFTISVCVGARVGVKVFHYASLSLSPTKWGQGGSGLKLERDWPVPVRRPETGSELGELHVAQLPPKGVEEAAEVGFRQRTRAPRAV